MSPPSAVEGTSTTNGATALSQKKPINGETPSNDAPHEPAVTEDTAVKALAAAPRPPTFEDKYEEREYLKGRLTAAFRIFGKLGFEEGVAGHITVRDPVEPDTFWVNPFGVAFRLMKRSDLIRVNDEGKVIEGGPVKFLNTAAYMIHHAVHYARPDVIAAAHSHSIYGRVFCTLGRNLDITTQDTCAFYNDLALYEGFNGIVLAKEEGIAIARSLGQKKAALLQNHGILTTGQTVEEAVFWFMSLEKCCHAQLMADAAAAGRGGETVKINDEDAAFTHRAVGSPLAGWFSAKPEFDVTIKESGEEFLD